MRMNKFMGCLAGTIVMMLWYYSLIPLEEMNHILIGLLSGTTWMFLDCLFDAISGRHER